MVSAIAPRNKNRAARRLNMRAVRRERIKKWHLENHNFELEDRFFERDEEDKALAAIEKWEFHTNLAHCAEDTEARQFAEENAGTQEVLAVLEVLRVSRGVSEDDKEGVQALLTKMSIDASSMPEDEWSRGYKRIINKLRSQLLL